MKIGEGLFAIIPNVTRAPNRCEQGRDVRFIAERVALLSTAGSGLLLLPGIFDFLAEFLFEIRPAAVVCNQGATEILRNLLIYEGESRKPAQ